MIDNVIKKNTPLVTVAVPCYNHEGFVQECIESIVGQTYKNIELIVVDDGSSDRSPEILTDLQKKHGFKLFLQTNQGLPKTINTILKNHTRGVYFSLCASDDYWLPEKIEKQVAFMEANRFYPMCYGKTYYVDKNSKIIENGDKNNRRLRGGWLFNDIFLFKIHPPVNYMYKTSLFDEVGYYDEAIIAEDYYMNLKISSKYPIGFLDDYLGFYRITDPASRIDMLNQIYDSHLIAIDGFSDHALYNKAKTMVYLRKFDLFSASSKYKKKAIIYLFKSLPFFHEKLFLVACINLIVSWKKS